MPSLPRRILRGVSRRFFAIPRRARALAGGLTEIVEEELFLVSSAGYQLRAHIHRPVVEGLPRPGVVLCPGIDAPGSAFDGWNEIVNASELARLGLVVMHFDPAGRGESWGAEDFGGPEHQDDLLVMLRFLLGRPDVVPQRSGVLSISMGLSMAAGALASAGQELPIGWLLDWEGPSDREIITANGRLMKPAMGHPLTDDTYWIPREPVRHIGKLKCGYSRFQAERDHAQPGEFRHALRMVQAAQRGSLPWFQLNDHPRGELPEEPRWHPSGYRIGNQLLIEKIRELCAL